jgi:hypothetical protein
MKTIARSALYAATLLIGAGGLTAQETSWFDQWYQQRFGRTSPAAEERQKAERANTAFREETRPAAAPANRWFDQWYQTKFGRISPREEARRKAEQANTAYREEPKAEATAPARSWFDRWYEARFGRTSPKEEAAKTSKADQGKKPY